MFYSKITRNLQLHRLFGNEDVDQRTLTIPTAGPPLTLLPPVISFEKNKDDCTKLKTTTISDCDVPKPLSDNRNRDRLQEREQEIGMLGWEKDGPAGSQNFGNDENIRKDHPGMHPRIPGPGGPRWQSPWQQPWPHGPPFPPGGPQGFPGGPVGPWQNQPRMFGGPIRPDFNPPFNPRICPPPMVPNGPMMMPMNPMVPMSSMGPSMMMGIGPVIPDHAAKQNSLNLTGPTTIENDTGELPPADPQVLEEIAKDTMKSISIDDVPREIRYYGYLGVVFLNEDDPRDIGFQDGTRRIIIDGKNTIACSFNQDYKEFTYGGEIHR